MHYCMFPKFFVLPEGIVPFYVEHLPIHISSSRRYQTAPLSYQASSTDIQRASDTRHDAQPRRSHVACATLTLLYTFPVICSSNQPTAAPPTQFFDYGHSANSICASNQGQFQCRVIWLQFDLMASEQQSQVKSKRVNC